uniref:Uncharacterized protein n=1 Tax=Rhizophora mucronata TaxID=61149 RepID=A0A2P2PR22_RHIMU
MSTSEQVSFIRMFYMYVHMWLVLIKYCMFFWYFLNS